MRKSSFFLSILLSFFISLQDIQAVEKLSPKELSDIKEVVEFSRKITKKEQLISLIYAPESIGHAIEVRALGRGESTFIANFYHYQAPEDNPTILFIPGVGGSIVNFPVASGSNNLNDSVSYKYTYSLNSGRSSFTTEIDLNKLFSSNTKGNMPNEYIQPIIDGLNKYYNSNITLESNDATAFYKALSKLYEIQLKKSVYSTQLKNEKDIKNAKKDDPVWIDID